MITEFSIKTVMEHTGCDRKKAEETLLQSHGSIGGAIWMMNNEKGNR